MAVHLTKASVAGLTLPTDKKDFTFFDTKLKGFGLRLREGGKRSWIYVYRRDGRLRKLTIGSAEILEPSQAREAARREMAKAIVDDVDPAEARKTKRRLAGDKLADLVESFLEDAQARVTAGKMRPRYFDEVERHLRVQMKPLHGISFHLITSAEISSRLKAIAASNGPFAANRARASLSAMFAWAMKSDGLAKSNPVITTMRPLEDEKERERVLSSVELAEIWKHSGAGDYASICRLLMLFGARRDEVGGMRWSELDLDENVWTIPATRAKNGIACALPISALARTEIDAVARREKRDLLFGARDQSFSGWSKAKAQLDARIVAARQKAAEESGREAKPLEPWRLHDMRRTMSTVMNDHLDILPHIVEVTLNHVTGRKKGSAGVYNRAAYLRQKRQALDAWGAHIATLIGVHGGQ